MDGTDIYAGGRQRTDEKDDEICPDCRHREKQPEGVLCSRCEELRRVRMERAAEQ